jgi:hypothetical protein
MGDFASAYTNEVSVLSALFGGFILIFGKMTIFAAFVKNRLNEFMLEIVFGAT